MKELGDFAERSKYTGIPYILVPTKKAKRAITHLSTIQLYNI